MWLPNVQCRLHDMSRPSKNIVFTGRQMPLKPLHFYCGIMPCIAYGQSVSQSIFISYNHSQLCNKNSRLEGSHIDYRFIAVSK